MNLILNQKKALTKKSLGKRKKNEQGIKEDSQWIYLGANKGKKKTKSKENTYMLT